MYYYTLVVLAYATFLLDKFSNVRNKEKYSCYLHTFFSL